MKLIAITKEELPDAASDVVFDIEVEEDHSYCVSDNSIVVHNCSTRLVAGTGIPQLSVLLECYSAAQQTGVHVIADGGCTNPGDFAKAFVASSFVMAGGFFAGYNETGNKFYGMSSAEAMIKHHGKIAPHRASEGHTFEFEQTKGPLQDRINYLLGGLRSACTYQNVNNLTDFQKKAHFVRVNHQNNTMFFK